VCYGTTSAVIIESEKEIDCMKVSAHAVEVFEVKGAAASSPAYIDIEIAQ
jgi:hypothetical protein